MEKSFNNEIKCDCVILFNLLLDESDIPRELVSPVTETSKFKTQPFIPTDVSVDATVSDISRPNIVQSNNLLGHLTSRTSC